MALNFPASPTIGQQYVAPNNVIYEWDGYKWQSTNGVVPERILEKTASAEVVSSGTTEYFTVSFDGPDSLNDPTRSKERFRIFDSGVTATGGSYATLGANNSLGSTAHFVIGNGIYKSYANISLISSSTQQINFGTSAAPENINLYVDQSVGALLLRSGSNTGNAFLPGGGANFYGPVFLQTSNTNPLIVNNGIRDLFRVRDYTSACRVSINAGSSPESTLSIVETVNGGRGAELSIVNYGNTRGASAVGTEAALNFGLDNSTYGGNDGNAQIKAIITSSPSSDSALAFSTWNGSSFGERVRIDGTLGSKLLINATTPTYSFQDANLRPTLYLSGQYPVVALNHTVTNNINHGPTLQFTCNGVGNQFVIGTGGTGNMLTMGYSAVTDWNPHNGISGYNGTSYLGATTAGYLGLCAPGDWGPSGGTGSNTPGYHLHVVGGNNAVNGHTGFFDNQVNAANNGSGFLFRNLYGNHSWGIVAEFRVEANGGADRPSILFSNGYNSTTYSVGFGYSDNHFRIKRDHGHRNGGWGTDLLRIETGNTAYFIGGVVQNASDERLKTKLSTIDNPLEKIKLISGYYFHWNEQANTFDLRKNLDKRDVGLVAQEVMEVMPEIIDIAPFDRGSEEGTSKSGEYYLTIQYEKLIPLLVESIKAQQQQIEQLQKDLDGFKNQAV